jgi:two-component system sensor histidine kinase RpfC
MGAPWYGVFLWVTLGNGFRYGEKFLYLSSIVSLIGFITVVVSTTYWSTNIELSIGLAVTLLVVPAYSALLIRRLNDALQRADSASRAKSDFLSCMSHEIRTPLNGILGMTDLLRLSTLSPGDKECVDTIHASGHALARQINEILDLSKIEAGQLTLEEIEFDLYALINTTLRIFQPQVDAKQIQLRENLDTKTPYSLLGDPHKLRQVITNLVGNAIKFTDNGFVSLNVYTRQLETDRAVLRFEIADTGIGIAPERLQAIFEPFTQADSSVSRSYGGTGLGTTICKNIVELMGGEIGVHSTPNVGTTFWFDVPFTLGEKHAPCNIQPWTGECKVLCLVPEAGMQGSILPVLEDWQMHFDTAETIRQAVDLIHNKAASNYFYDCLYIDGIPYDDELIDLLSGIKSDIAYRATSVILADHGNYPTGITGNTHDQVFVLDTPVDKRILFNTLHACYSRHSTEEDILHIAHKKNKPDSSAKPLRILIGDDNATNRVVLQRMLETLGHQCVVVTGGEAILESLETGDYDAVIADKNMPDLGGLEAFQAHCLAHGGEPPPNFIILTADATEECRSSCEAAGIRFFLTKPVSLARLREMLSMIQVPGRKTVAETMAAGNSTMRNENDNDIANELPVIDGNVFADLTSLSGGNNAFLIELISNFKTDAENDIRGLETSVASHDWDAFRDFAHALKGGALYLGLARLAELSATAQHIEKDEFDQNGITHILSIRQAADDALCELEIISSKLQQSPESGQLSG